MNEQRLVFDDDDDGNTDQVQAFINYIELMTARVESMNDYESWIAIQDTMEYESESDSD